MSAEGRIVKSVGRNRDYAQSINTSIDENQKLA